MASEEQSDGEVNSKDSKRVGTLKIPKGVVPVPDIEEGSEARVTKCQAFYSLFHLPFLRTLWVRFHQSLFPWCKNRDSERLSYIAKSYSWWKWKSLSCVQLFATHGLFSPWNSSGQNTGAVSHSLLQGIFPTQGSNPGLPHCRWILCQLSHREAQEYWRE